MEGVLKAYKVFGYLKGLGVWISGISVLAMMFFISYDVFIRNVFSGSIRGGFEIVQNYLMPLVVFPSLAYVYSSGVLPKMDLIMARLGEKMQKGLIYFMLLIELFILVLIVQFSWEFAMNGMERKTAFPAAGTMYILYPLFFIIPVAFTMIIIENIFILIRNIKEKKATLLVIDKSGELEGF